MAVEMPPQPPPDLPSDFDYSTDKKWSERWRAVQSEANTALKVADSSTHWTCGGRATFDRPWREPTLRHNDKLRGSRAVNCFRLVALQVRRHAGRGFSAGLWAPGRPGLYILGGVFA
jgi:hypothetical protein